MFPLLDKSGSMGCLFLNFDDTVDTDIGFEFENFHSDSDTDRTEMDVVVGGFVTVDNNTAVVVAAAERMKLALLSKRRLVSLESLQFQKVAGRLREL